MSGCNNRIKTSRYPSMKSVKFYPMFLALSFCLFRNIFGRSTLVAISSNRCKYYSELAHDHTTSRWYLLFGSEYYRRRSTSHNHVRMAREETKFYLAEVSQKVWSVHHENLRDNIFFEERAFYCLNLRIMPIRSQDIIFSVLAVKLQKMKKISKYFHSSFSGT